MINNPSIILLERTACGRAARLTTESPSDRIWTPIKPIGARSLRDCRQKARGYVLWTELLGRHHL